jgi:hypothetical protein
MDELTSPTVTPTGRRAGATTDRAKADAAPGTAPGPDDPAAPHHDYRRLENGKSGAAPRPARG